MGFLETIRLSLYNNAITNNTIIAVLFADCVLSLYEYIVYRCVSKKGLYNNSFNQVVVLIPFFISTIVLCLQSNAVITLGTIGALAIIRFRTAIKDPTDMLYLLWSIQNGIMTGCQLYKIAIATSAVVTIVLVIFKFTPLMHKKYTLVIKSTLSADDNLMKIIKDNTRCFTVKARNFKQEDNAVDYFIELDTKDINKLIKSLSTNDQFKKYSILENDGD